VQGSPSASGAPTSPTRATPGPNPAGASLVLKPAKSPRASPPSLQSHRLGDASGSQHGEGSSKPWPKEPPRQHSLDAESLWDNLDFIHAGFYIGRLVTTAVGIEADRENIKALYSSMQTTSAQIDVSHRQPTLLHLPGMDLIPSLCRPWLNTLRIRINS
jgi:hypothetical protein